MRYIVHAVVLFGAAAAAFLWLTATVPGGEKRYEHWLREVQERHAIDF